MAANIRENLAKAAEWIWGSNLEMQDNSFKGPLLALSKLQNDPAAEKKYLLECVEKIAKDLDGISFYDLLNCSLVAKNLCPVHLGNFYLEVDRLATFEDVNSKRIKDSFQTLCVERILTCWVQDAIESFYPIFSLSDKEEQISTAQKWTHHFLTGIRYFDSLGGGLPMDFAKVPGTYKHYTRIVMENFEAYAQKKLLEQIESIVKITNQEKEFHQRVQSAASRIHKGLSSEDLKYLEFIENVEGVGASLFSGKVSSIERKKSLLLRCAMHGFTLQTFERSILNDESSPKMFSDAISTYQAECLEAFSKTCENVLKSSKS